jgi:TRAP-type C4-dicarboxylate transport system permease small subunit
MWIGKTARFLEKILSPLSATFNTVGGIALTVMMVIIAVDVIARDSLNVPIPGAVELVTYFMAIVVAFGIAYCGLMKGHIFADAIVSRIGSRPKRVLFTITTLIGLVTVSIMTWQSFIHMQITASSGLQSAMLAIPAAPFVGAVGFGLGLYSLVLLKDLLKLISSEGGK